MSTKGHREGRHWDYEKIMGALKYRARGMGHTTEFMMKVYLAGHPGGFEKSAELGEKIYGIECRTLGEEDKKTFSTLGLLALTYIESGSWEKGLKLAEKAYGIWSRLYGEEDLSALKLLSYMAEVYDGLGDHGEVLRLCGRIKETGAEIPQEIKKRINRILSKPKGCDAGTRTAEQNQT